MMTRFATRYNGVILIPAKICFVLCWDNWSKFLQALPTNKLRALNGTVSCDTGHGNSPTVSGPLLVHLRHYTLTGCPVPIPSM